MAQKASAARNSDSGCSNRAARRGPSATPSITQPGPASSSSSLGEEDRPPVRGRRSEGAGFRTRRPRQIDAAAAPDGAPEKGSARWPDSRSAIAVRMDFSTTRLPIPFWKWVINPASLGSRSGYRRIHPSPHLPAAGRSPSSSARDDAPTIRPRRERPYPMSQASPVPPPFLPAPGRGGPPPASRCWLASPSGRPAAPRTALLHLRDSRLLQSRRTASMRGVDKHVQHLRRQRRSI